MTLHHNLIDIFNQRIYPAEIIIENHKIISIKQTTNPCKHYILPGFVDAHIHIESSMLIPSEFARIAVTHGTVATISDPHEIANVCGVDGIDYMISNAKKVPFKFFFGAPSCVPATTFETAGATLNSQDIDTLLQRNDIYYLSEMMNYPGVINNDEEIRKKIDAAKKYNKPVDGHAPNVRGEAIKKYIQAGITTDHECTTLEEAEEKIKLGMKILIREGSAAKNFDALIPLLHKYPSQIMFCCDDKHPDDLLEHHINFHVKHAINQNNSLFNVLQAACINPVLHYNIPVGLLRIDDAADFIIVDNTTDFTIIETYIDGECVYKNGTCSFQSIPENVINNFVCAEKNIEDFKVSPTEKIKVIVAHDGQLITTQETISPLLENKNIVSDIKHDILKIAVVNRYANKSIAMGFIKNFGLKKGAIASTVAHDSHNIIAIGISDEEIKNAVNALVISKGGIVATLDKEIHLLPLEVAGLMSLQDAKTVGKIYGDINLFAKQKLGSTLSSPFMTLSFMALLVIPQLKLSDKGLFDAVQFRFC